MKLKSKPTTLPISRKRTTREYVYLVRLISVCSCDLDLDPMTLIYELAPDVLRTKNKVSRSMLSKVRAGTGQTDRETRPRALLAAFKKTFKSVLLMGMVGEN